VPLAMTVPRSMITIVPASRSASSMYCVVSSTLVPAPVSSPSTACDKDRYRILSVT
jgi:hypothetical protein